MVVIRRNIVADTASRKDYIRGVTLLKQEIPTGGLTTTDLDPAATPLPLSTYDHFVVWHWQAMMTMTPPSQSERNSAHSGPVFLPWHRYMLLILEAHLQRVLGDDEFGLPYWDWAADGDLPAANQPGAAIWQDDCMGGQGVPVTSGPFAFNELDPKSWRIRVGMDPATNNLEIGLDRGLERAFGSQSYSSDLPKKADVGAALEFAPYDVAPWNSQSGGFRNKLEGWAGISEPELHNRVHVWIYGDMFTAMSPNDPVFYLNHCNVDRIWQRWLRDNGPSYLPPQSAAAQLLGHRENDEIRGILGPPTTPAAMLDVSEIYVYDNLDVEE